MRQFCISGLNNDASRFGKIIKGCGRFCIPFFVPFIVSAALDTTTDTAAVPVTNYFTRLVTTGAAVPTLADGAIVGQLKKIQMTTDAGDAVLTPTNLNGGTTITFADIGDTAELLFDGAGWQVLSLYNNADGTTAPVLA